MDHEERSQNLESVSQKEQLESIKSFQSSIRKMEKALAQMTEKGANATVVKKRLNALYVGLAMLESVWSGNDHPYTREELTEARDILEGLLPSIEGIYEKSKEGSPQKTLLHRRIRSLDLSIQAIDLLSREE
jgi:hypothetical protein